MRRAGVVVAITVLGFGSCLRGEGHGNFSGTWKMDPARSESMHQDVPLGSSTVIVSMGKNLLTIETRRTGDEKSPDFDETLRFTLDGKETTSAGYGGASVTGRAHWDGSKLVVETARVVQNATVTTVYVHTLSPNGAEMTIDKTLTVQHGYMGQSATNVGHGKDVFVRVSR